MRLKQIKLAGFKSFVEPTKVPFLSDMTAIVGPNGCGKSNIIDAVRWVLGESSAKNLRGDAMTDVIFNGSTQRSAVSKAMVELIFDNSLRRLVGEYSNYNEVSVRRVVLRDGSNQYFLNGTKCRRKDVTELFMGTGLGPRSYAIIEQGMISRLIESRPQELRVFFEEAAGVSRYKEKRRETETRIRHTKENLERLADIRQELSEQVTKLQGQAQAAQQYKQLKAQQRELKSLQTLSELARLQLKLDSWAEKSSHAKEKIEQIEVIKTSLEAKLVEQELGQRHQSEQQQTLQTRFYQNATEITKLEQQHKHYGEQQLVLGRRQDQLKQQLTEKRLRYANEQNELEFTRTELALQDAQLQEFGSLLEQDEDNQRLVSAELELAESEVQDVNARHSQFERQQHQLSAKIDAAAKSASSGSVFEQPLLAELQRIAESNYPQQLNETNTEQDKLDHAQQTLVIQLDELSREAITGEKAYQLLKHEVGVKLNHLTHLQAESAALAELLAQIEGENGAELPLSVLLSDVIQVAPGWEVAVEKVLGFWLHGQYVEETPELSELESLDLVFSASERPQSDSLQGKVSGPLPDGLLTNVIPAESRAEALELRRRLAPGESVITPGGDWFGTNWVSQGQRQFNLLEAKQKRIRLEQDIGKLQIQLKKGKQDLQQAKEQLESVNTGHKQASLQCNELKLTVQRNQLERSQLQQKMAEQQARKTEITQQLEHHGSLLIKELRRRETLDQELEVLTEQVQQLVGQKEQAQLKFGQIKENSRQMMSSIEQLQKKRAHAQLKKAELQAQQGKLETLLARDEQSLDILRKELEQVESGIRLPSSDLDQQKALDDLLAAQVVLDTEKETTRQAILQLDRNIKQLKEGRQKSISELKTWLTQLEQARLESQGLSARRSLLLEQLGNTGAKFEELKNIYSEADLNLNYGDKLKKLDAKLSRFGSVNLAAVEEFEALQTRKTYLDQQCTDLEKALEMLEIAIRKIDRETRVKFSETFDKVNSDLKQLFPKVFGGGTAWLELTSDELLDAGVTIVAQPPGKNNTSITLLSGGEKALTALSLVFAIFRLNPAPFCMLDEVDAPLDEVNVSRYCALVKEMSSTVQFIYISHNKVSMEMASHLTGVTMHEPGVSRIVAVDVEEAFAMTDQE